LGALDASVRDPSGSPELNAALVAPILPVGSKVAAQGKGNGLLWPEGYEKVPQDLLDLEEDAAKATGGDWATRLATTARMSSGRPPWCSSSS